MAKPTSASTRSKRKTNKPVTQGQNPQRSNRQRVSTAQVTTGGGRGNGTARVTNGSQRTNTGSAPVTTSTRPALPPGQRGGAITPRPSGGGNGAAPRLPGGTGGVPRLPGGTGGGDRVTGSGVRTGRPGATRPALPAATTRPSGGGVPRLPGAVRSGMGGPVAMAVGLLAEAALGPLARSAGTAIGQGIRQSVTPQRTGTSSGRTGRGGTSADAKPTSSARPRVGNIPPAEGTGRGGPSDVNRNRTRPAAKPTTTPTPTRSQTIQQRATQPPRSSNSGGTVSTPRRATPTSPTMPAVVKERRVSGSTANRESGNYGTSRSNNPLIDDTMKARMRRREDATGVGPVKDGAQYAGDVKGSTRGVGPVTDGDKYSSNIKAKSDKLSPEEKKRIKERYS